MHSLPGYEPTGGVSYQGASTTYIFQTLAHLSGRNWVYNEIHVALLKNKPPEVMNQQGELVIRVHLPPTSFKPWRIYPEEIGYIMKSMLHF